MRIHVFVSDTHLDVVGFTADETGANLPAAFEPWREEVEPGILVIAADDDPIAEAVRRMGSSFFPVGATADGPLIPLLPGGRSQPSEGATPRGKHSI